MILSPFSTQYGKPSKADIKQYEELIGMTLPDDYRNLLLKHNGGSVEESERTVQQVGEEVSIDVLYGFNIMPQLNLVERFQALESELPELSFPIGRDPGGNPFLMDMADASQPGAVYYWDIHRMLKKRTKKAVAYQLTKSFAEFITDMTVSKEK